MTACDYCFSTDGHHVQCPNFQTVELAATRDLGTGPTVWILSTGEDHEGGTVLGVYTTKKAAKGPFVEAARRIPFDLDNAWQDDDTGAVHAHGGCDWVSLEPHPLIAREQLICPPAQQRARFPVSPPPRESGLPAAPLPAHQYPR